MTDPTMKGWPDPLPNPFTLFGAALAGQPAATSSTSPMAAPLAQGLAGGMEMFKKFWGNLPGGTALPGFLVPTVDVAELDKRIADLRAAESWLDVNVNLLRATIQGLEVQRHTIAAIQSISALGDPKAPTPAAPAISSGWPVPAAVSPPAASPPAASPPTASPPAPVPPPPSAPSPTSDPQPAADASLISAAAGNWLGFMQEQFAKVAQAALAPSAPAVDAAAPAPSRRAVTSAKKPTARKRKPAARKSAAR